MIVEGRIRIPYRWPAGRAGGRFLAALAEGRIVGARCPRCRRVTVPPVGRCHGETEPVPVATEGVVTTWTSRHGRILALIQLDGADTALLHEILDGPVRTGQRVIAVFKEGRLLGFRP